MRRRVAALGCVAALVVAASTAAAKSYRAESYTSEVEILADGDLRVTEEVVFRFEDGPFTHAYRTLPLRHVDGIEIESSPQPFEVRKRNRVEVTWRFEPCQDTTRRFALTYRVHGVLGRHGDRRVLDWRAFPDERRFVIDRTTTRVTWPAAWPEPLAASARPDGAGIERRPDAITFTTGRLGRERTLRLCLEFDAAAAAGAPLPVWQQRNARWAERAPLLAAIAAALLLLGIALVWMQYRELAPGGGGERSMLPVTSPPSDLPAPLAGALRAGDAGLLHAVACFTDLAARGWVVFEMERAKTRWSGGKYVARRLRPGHDLEPWERIVLEAAFRGADTVAVPRAWEGIRKQLGAFKAAVRDELRRRGDLDPTAEERRKRMWASAAVWWIASAGALAAVPLVWSRLGPGALLPGVGLAIVAGVALVAASSLPRYSEQGRARAGAWRSFGAHLQRLAKQRGAAMDARRFQDWFPYALALGAAPAWLGAGKRWKFDVPGWFRVSAGDTTGMAGLAAVYAASGSEAGAGGAGGAGTGGAGGGGGGAG